VTVVSVVREFLRFFHSVLFWKSKCGGAVWLRRRRRTPWTWCG